MPRYVRLISFTEQGVKNIRNLSKMYDEAKRILEREGAKIVETYVTLGRYDIIGIIEAPNDKVAMKTSALIGANEAVKIETLPAMSMTEFIKTLG